MRVFESLRVWKFESFHEFLRAFESYGEFESFWEFLRVFESFWEFSRVLESFWMFLRVYESLWEVLRVFKSFWEFLILFNESTRLIVMALFLLCYKIWGLVRLTVVQINLCTCVKSHLVCFCVSLFPVIQTLHQIL